MTDDLYYNDWIEIDGNSIHKTAIVHPNVRMGTGNTIGAYTVIGSNGEIRGVKQDDFKGHVVIGDNNVISEFVTIQRPLAQGEATIVGSGNIIMAHVHIGHDAVIGNKTEVCVGTVIGGYAVVKDKAKVKLSSTIRNRITIGEGAVVGMGSVVTKNVPEGVTVMGVPAKEK